MESFDYHEYDQFLIGITKLENPTEKDLINTPKVLLVFYMDEVEKSTASILKFNRMEYLL